MVRKRTKTVLFGIYCAIMLALLFCRQSPDFTAANFSYWSWVKNNTHLTLLGTTSYFADVITNPEGYLSWMDAASYLAARHHAIINLVGNVVMFCLWAFSRPCFSVDSKPFGKHCCWLWQS